MKKDEFDLTYATIDSVLEGVGSSQIKPLVYRLAKAGLKVNLVSYEKSKPSQEFTDYFSSIGVNWKILHFGTPGLLGGLGRLNNLRLEMPRSGLIHARSDLPAVSAIYSDQGPVLWDVRSLWADQKVTIQNNLVNQALYRSYRKLERIAANKSHGMSTLTRAIVPILEQRNNRLPELRTVVPTAVDLQRFRLRPKMPTQVRALFSGTYNQYYDLDLSARFMSEFRKLITTETHWAKPAESRRSQINLGESKVLVSSQIGMAELIPNYSFGVSICRLDAGPSLSAAMPTKIAEFLACGRPIVVNRGLGDMDQFIEEFDAGIILDGSTDNLKEGAFKLAGLLSDADTPNRCRALAEKYFNIDVGTSNYLSLYSKISNLKT